MVAGTPSRRCCQPVSLTELHSSACVLHSRFWDLLQYVVRHAGPNPHARMCLPGSLQPPGCRNDTQGSMICTSSCPACCAVPSPHRASWLPGHGLTSACMHAAKGVHKCSTSKYIQQQALPQHGVWTTDAPLHACMHAALRMRTSAAPPSTLNSKHRQVQSTPSLHKQPTRQTSRTAVSAPFAHKTQQGQVGARRPGCVLHCTRAHTHTPGFVPTCTARGWHNTLEVC